MEEGTNLLDEQYWVAMRSIVTDSQEVLQSGMLKNVEKGMCLGRKGGGSLNVVAVECDSQYVELWSPIDSKYELLGNH